MSNPEQLKQEIEAIENAITNPTSEENVAGNQDSTEEVVQPTQASEDLETTTDPSTPVEDTPEQKEKKTYTNWKKRFTNLKASQDSTIFDLRQDNIRQAETIKSLSDKTTKLEEMVASLSQATNSDDLSSVITPEEAEILGPEAVSSMNKIMKAANENAVRPLADQLKELKQTQREMEDAKLASQQAQNTNLFLERLGNAVEDYQTIDKDPAFHEFMDEIDPDSGYVRKRLFKVAEHSGDVGRVAGFFKDFKATLNTAVNPILEDAITPTNSAKGSTETKTNDNTIPWKEVSDFYDEANRGGYKGREAERLVKAAKYDLALQEQRVDFNS